MTIVVALGGNALLRREQLLTAENQLDNIKRAAMQLAQLAMDYQLVITHGNGPQIGLLALQNAADVSFAPYPLDLLGAETDGMIGYLLEQELANQLSPERVVACFMISEVLFHWRCCLRSYACVPAVPPSDQRRDVGSKGLG